MKSNPAPVTDRTAEHEAVEREAFGAPAFDSITVESLRNTGSMKWTKYPDSLAAFVAEMDFGVAPPVKLAVDQLMQRGLTGYMPQWIENELREATATWFTRHHGWDLSPDQVFPVADVIQAYQFAIEHFTRPSSKIILLTPAYGPFFLVPKLFRRNVIEVPMLRTPTGWDIDEEGLARAFEDGGGLLVLCNPHNPIGYTYRREQLARICRIVDQFDGRVFSDEIHAALTYPGNTHIPYASISTTAAGHTLTATSASKAFNIPGLKCAQLIASNAADQERLEELGVLITHGASNVGAVANTAAFAEGDEWFASVLAYLEGNRIEMSQAIAEHLPLASYLVPEATYFAWIDLSAYSPPAELQRYLIDEARVAISDGAAFGSEFGAHVRFNFAMPREEIAAAVRAIAAALTDREA